MPTISISAGQSDYVDFDVGPHSLPVGTTKNKSTPANLPVRRRVRLADQRTGRTVRTLWSDATTGEYQFQNIRSGTFMVYTLDHTLTYGGEIETDIVVPAP